MNNMQQINDNIGRHGYDGTFRTWTQIERAHKRKFRKEIVDALSDIIAHESNNEYRQFFEWCKKNTPDWLVAKPADLQKLVEECDKEETRKLLDDEYIKAKLDEAYKYERSKLLDLAKWLNIKSCPYCNMQYTLFARDYEENKDMAKFQFDHFYNKARYPMLRMALYNLIPSCVSCNQGKSDGKLGLRFHPYHSAIKDTFRFKVKEPLPLIVGGKSKKISIELEAPNDKEFGAFTHMFRIKALYQRHDDVVREVFARAYADEYYSYLGNFAFLRDGKLAERIIKGFYAEEDEIELRPLTKFQQDLWKQAKGIMK